MTEIAFHVNVPDKLAYSCRLLRKAYLSGALVAVTAEPEVLIELDRLLWSFSPTDFVPHALVSDASEPDLALTPILLTEPLSAFCHNKVLVNLGREVPTPFEGFERVIEVVSDDHETVLPGRPSCRAAATTGFPPTNHVAPPHRSSPVAPTARRRPMLLPKANRDSSLVRGGLTSRRAALHHVWRCRWKAAGYLAIR